MAELVPADIAWMLMATALVLVMTPALALFYGGLVRSKNVLSTFMHSFFALGLVTVQWVVLGYSLAFAPTQGGIIGAFDYAFFQGVGLEPKGNIPHVLFAAFQMMFAIITPALISGAFAERIKFSAYVLFSLLWTTCVYDPLAHWVWSPGGWLAKRGALDFAGGTVVHVAAGISALVIAVMVGRRSGYPHRKAPPHNLTMTLLGAGLLWFGWFGFNAGSALGANSIAALALVNTHIAAALGGVAWASVEWIRYGKPSALGVASGLVAGLVAITPAAGFVGPVDSLWIGMLAGVLCYAGVLLKHRLGYDDALDAFGVHGIGGAAGAILTGVFASTAWNPHGGDGLLHGGTSLFWEQILATAATGCYAIVVTFAIVKFVDSVIGFRPLEYIEQEGLDYALHGEEAYGDALDGQRLPSEIAELEGQQELVRSAVTPPALGTGAQRSTG
ncbi:MAG: ammonium transporter [Myxococcales bacterium]|nr:ammonium transporter [Myxococcales bacterium]